MFVFFCITFQYHCSVFCGRKAKTKCASIHARQQRHGIFCWTTYARPVFTGIIPRPAVSNTHSNILNRSLLPNGKSRLRPMHRSTIYVGVGCCVVASGFSTYVDCPKLYIYWHIAHTLHTQACTHLCNTLPEINLITKELSHIYPRMLTPPPRNTQAFTWATFVAGPAPATRIRHFSTALALANLWISPFAPPLDYKKCARCDNSHK